ncbi:MAG: hypothetical protein KJO07_16270, partial [Deltaproteobacteria bacterium]|nr:hypothetical protein [Deltaproteobacteria bacterium]
MITPTHLGALLLAMAVAASPAAAQPGVSSAPTEQAESYTGTIVLVDALSLGTFALAGVLGENDDGYGDDTGLMFAMLGLSGWMVGPGIVHAAKGDRIRGLASVGLRLGLPVAGGLVGGLGLSAALSGGGISDEDSQWVGVGTMVGFLGGAITATLLDQLWLAKPGHRRAAGLSLT